MIVILTDFSDKDIYTPVMKGVIKSLSPDSEIITLTNSIQAQNVIEAAFVLGNTYKYFPKGSVFLCVVDPGVGTDRKAIVVHTEDYYFVLPDNGLISEVSRNEEILNVIEISINYKTSDTFHGRDVFAPVAAKIDSGMNLKSFGKNINVNEITTLSTQPIIRADYVEGFIIHTDSFGNAISNIHYNHLQEHDIHSVNIGDNTFSRINNTFSDVNEGEPLAYIGSFEYLEFAVRNGNYVNEFNCNYFEKVKIIFDSNS